MNPFLIALRPLRHYADFKGRSTRTELVLFAILTGVVSFVEMMAGFVAGLPDFALADVAGIAFLCPSLAVAVRRLHDSGRSGWWLTLAGPGAIANIWRQIDWWRDPWAIPSLGPPWYIDLPCGLSSLAVTVMLFWPGDDGPNAYGPNPRHPEWDTAAESGGEPA